jgi:hypothetical protein
MVGSEGYVWEGQRHSSLSAIARSITGTAWSGPRFFALKCAEHKKAQAQPSASAGAFDKPDKSPRQAVVRSERTLDLEKAGP